VFTDGWPVSLARGRTRADDYRGCVSPSRDSPEVHRVLEPLSAMRRFTPIVFTIALASAVVTTAAAGVLRG